MSLGYINSGTKDKPKWWIVESKWSPKKHQSTSKKHCLLGKFSNVDDAITMWKFIAKDAGRLERKSDRSGVALKSTNQHSPSIRLHARGWSHVRIKAKLNKLRKWKLRLAHQESGKSHKKLKRSFQKRIPDPRKSMKLKMALAELNELISLIRRDNHLAHWNADIKSSVKNLLQNVITFHGEL